MADIVGGTVVWNLDVNNKPLIDGLDDANKRINDAANKVNDSGKEITKTFKSVGKDIKSIGKELSVGITAPIVAAGAVAVSFTKIGGQYSSVLDAFKSMTQGMGVDAVAFQKAVADATGGQLDNLTILQGATRGLSLIGKEAFNDFGTDFVKMAEMSKKAARATGQDVDYMFNSLVLGVSRESKLILDNLGISIDIAKAKDDYALSLGKTTAELTQSEEKHAVLNATMAQLQTTYGAVAISAGGFSGAAQQLTTFLTNARIEIGQNLEPSLSVLTKQLTEIGKDILPSVISAIKAVVDGFTSLDPNIQKGILGFIAFIAVLGPFLVIVGSMISTLGTVIKLITGIPALVGAVGKAFMALGPVFTFISANPIVLVIAAIIAVIALLAYIVVKNWDTIKAAFKAGFDFISGVVTGIVTFLGNMGSKIIKAIVKPFKDAKEAIAKIANDIKEAANNINPFVRHSPSLVDNVKKGIGIIQDEYSSLRDIKLPSIMSTLPSLSEPNYATVQSQSTTQAGSAGVTVNMPGAIIQSKQDVESLGREFGFRSTLMV